MQVKLKYLKPNPYRNIKEYPIIEEKVQSLKNSIRKTGWWKNVVCRKNGKHYELAYGHHRLQALNELYQPDKEIEVIVEDLSDEMMILIMADENFEVYVSTPAVVDETVKSTRDYLLANPDVAAKYRPKSEASDLRKEVTAKTISRFLGRNWPMTRVEESLTRINMIESGTLSKEAVHAFPTTASAMNFARIMKKEKATTEEQKEVVKILKKKKVKGKESIEQTLDDLRQFKGQRPGRKVPFDHIDFCSKEINSACRSAGNLNLRLCFLQVGLTQIRLFYGQPNREDIDVTQLNKLMGEMKELRFLYGEVEERFKLTMDALASRKLDAVAEEEEKKPSKGPTKKEVAKTDDIPIAEKVEKIREMVQAKKV